MERKTLQIELENVILRQFSADDAQDMFNNYCNDEEVTKYVTWGTHGKVENTKAYLESFLPNYNQEDYYHWAIVERETNQVIGAIGQVENNTKTKEIELGWVISKKFWSKGIMSACAKQVVKFLFDRGYEKVFAKFDAKNPASGKVMQKIGMSYLKVEEGEKVETYKEGTQFVVYFSITKEQYNKQNFYNNAYKTFGDFWGLDAQMRMAVEESSELIKEIMKFIRFSNDIQPENKQQKLKQIEQDLKSEIADALNCVEQMKFLFGEEEIEAIRKQKIERTFKKIEDMKNKKN